MNTSSIPYLSIIIPAYNEASRLIPTLHRLAEFATSQTYTVEILVVDDRSTDATWDKVKDFIYGRPGWRLMQNERNMGKGASVKAGMAATRGTYRLFTDADLSTPIEEVASFFPFMEGASDEQRYDIVIGSRQAKGARLEVHQPFYREMAGRFFSVLVRLIVLRGFLDTQCGFKLFTAGAADVVFPRLTIPGFGFDVEALYIANRHGLRIKEAPVRWRDSPQTRVRLFRDSLNMFADLLRIRWRAFRGRYNFGNR